MRPSASGTPGRARSVLVADDSGYTRSKIRDLLEPLGFQVLEAENGDSAIEVFFKHRPLVVVIDHVMRGKCGIDASKSLLARDPGARIILLTAINDEAVLQQAIEIGVLEVLPKSELSRLGSVVARLMDE